jgi:phosphoribosylanthranilate isomerase
MRATSQSVVLPTSDAQMIVSPKIKICGVTRPEDAELAVDLGAWAIGMIFYDQSPRRCSVLEAERIAGTVGRGAELCGVFVNAPMEEVISLQDRLGLTLIQLHGDEGPAFCQEIARRTGARVIKASQVGGVGAIRALERFHVNFHLLDAEAKAPDRKGMRGGTGETFDWGLIQGRQSQVPLLLSGGLNASNVAEAISAVRPYAICSASWTEASPGRKDPVRVRELFAAVAGAVEQPSRARQLA